MEVLVGRLAGMEGGGPGISLPLGSVSILLFFCCQAQPV